MPVFDAPDDEGDGSPRQSYNFAPGYYGMVYRADTPDWGYGSRRLEAGEADDEAEVQAERGMNEDQEVRYKLQSMKWGLIPFWTKRNPDYGTLMRTINCRDDSLIDDKGMWTSMKRKKRCIVIAQGFYEWLKKGKDKIPHYTKRKDGKLMCFAGLWDCVQYEDSDEKTYTYTVITTSPNKQIEFLHDRMPVILENGSEEITTWLDPKRTTWSKELQSLLKPFRGELEIYPVSKDVGKVGNNSENFIIPLSSSQNKSNIANFFSKGGTKGESKSAVDIKSASSIPSPSISEKKLGSTTLVKLEQTEDPTIIYDNPSTPITGLDSKQGIKREPEDAIAEEPSAKIPKTVTSPSKVPSPAKPKMRSATTNNTTSPKKVINKDKGSQKITSFFSK
ncbi:hypothetical protein OIDMADRAFT_153925 [Oidiodendron maius Zn]|uniref:DUF159 domain protein n=1 Tax=Oidiodendron maius (strain Zn) TaxID=913774 RepID=A0A0C3HTR7_OIDMZ|nr:hypothetical protein OIDMADRAFT_153925 [Oidiodendron maius Zn]